jgi:ferredoxin
MSSLPLPHIDRSRCIGCKRCVEICPTHALDQADGKAYLRFADLCTYCTACEDICPENAIALPFLIVLAANQPYKQKSAAKESGSID